MKKKKDWGPGQECTNSSLARGSKEEALTCTERDKIQILDTIFIHTKINDCLEWIQQIANQVTKKEMSLSQLLNSVTQYLGAVPPPPPPPPPGLTTPLLCKSRTASTSVAIA